MKYHDKQIPIGDIKAETFLSLIENRPYCDITATGHFNRNTSEEIIEMDEYKNILNVKLSRDGLMRHLPEALFFKESSLLHLREEAYHKELKRIKKEKRALQAFFRPFDTILFENNLMLEECINDYSENIDEKLIQFYFGIDLEKEKNPLIRQIAPFVLKASEIRGDFDKMQKLLEVLFKRKVELLFVEKSALITVQFIIHIPQLTTEKYKERMTLLGEFFAFFSEYFLPFDMNYDYQIKDKNQVFRLGENLILDYNTQI